MEYLFIIEKNESGYWGYVPDLPGCASFGETREQLTIHMKEAVEFHLEGMKIEGLTIPVPSTEAELLVIN
jgi:predicted RNase H-like HicB family nuclease